MQALIHELPSEAELHDIFSGIPKNIGLMKFMKTFHSEEVCNKYLHWIKWPKGVVCPDCGCTKVYLLKDGPRNYHKGRFQCSQDKICRRRFNVKTNTIFEGSKAGLDKWFYILFNYATVNKNFSSRNLSKQIGLTQTSAWKIMNKIRGLFLEKDFVRLSGIVEVDEAFLSKPNKRFNHKWGGMSARKEPILGMIERGGRVIIKAVENRRKAELERVILEHVEPESIVCTDTWGGYFDLNKYYHHFKVNHSEKQWTDGDCHTNNIEMVWGYFKKGIRGNLHQISDKHCQLYCDEFCYRFNRRSWSSMEKFNDLLRRACNANTVI